MILEDAYNKTDYRGIIFFLMDMEMDPWLVQQTAPMLLARTMGMRFGPGHLSLEDYHKVSLRALNSQHLSISAQSKRLATFKHLAQDAP